MELGRFVDWVRDSVQEADKVQNQANGWVQEMVLGKSDIHTAMIAMEKPGISFCFMLAVRNKTISAHEETLRIQGQVLLRNRTAGSE